MMEEFNLKNKINEWYNHRKGEQLRLLLVSELDLIIEEFVKKINEILNKTNYNENLSYDEEFKLRKEEINKLAGTGDKG